MRRTDLCDRRRLLAFTFGLVLVITQADVGRADDALRARLLTDAPKAWAKIATWAEHLEMTTSNRSEREVLRERTDVHLKLSGDNILGILTKFSPDDTAGQEDVYCRNARYSFHLRRSNAKLPWHVQRFGKTPNAEIDKIIFELLGVKVASQPQISIGAVYLPDVFGTESFEIKEVKARREGTTEFVSIAFENPLPERDKPVRWLSRGTLTLNPDLAWAVQNCDVYIEFAAGVTWHFQAENELTSSEGGIPIIKAQRGRINIKDQPESRFTYKLNDIKIRMIPDEEFKFSDFGLPEK
jgi:hypothetical protein